MATPLPPCRSGIADYATELIPELAGLIDLDVFAVNDDFSGPARPFSELDARYGDYDAVVLQVGNHGLFKPVIEFARCVPSVVVIHDLNLSGIYGAAYMKRGLLHKFFFEILRQEGTGDFLAASWKFLTTRRCPDENEYRMNRSVVRGARRIIVHSRAAADILCQTHGPLAVSVVPHGTPAVDAVDENRRLEARRKLDLPAECFIAGSFGSLDERKRTHVVMESFAELLKARPDARLCLVGPGDENWRGLADRMGVADKVRFTGWVGLDEFYDYIAAVDLCVNLRYPWFGEDSGPVLRVMAAGKPVIVTDIGSFAELPDGACRKIGFGSSESEELRILMTEFADSPSPGERIGSAARAYCLTRRSWADTARGYVEAVESTVADREVAR